MNAKPEFFLEAWVSRLVYKEESTHRGSLFRAGGILSRTHKDSTSL